MLKIISFVMLLSSWYSPEPISLQSDDAVVRAVLFYSPTCGHCQYVITEVLPPLFDKYGDKLQIIGIDVTQPGAGDLYRAALTKFNLESGGVPALVVGDQLIIGRVDIPERLPGLIEQYLAQGGMGWPDIPGLTEVLSAAESSQAATTETAVIHTDSTTNIMPTVTPQVANASTHTAPEFILTSHYDTNVWQRIARDPLGNSLAIIVLIGMLTSLVVILLYYRDKLERIQVDNFPWLIPLLSLLGIGIAVYMTYIETAKVSAFCGPIGDCNTVQQSEYARLFGVLPIGIIGLFGYIAMVITWTFSHFGKDATARLASLLLFLLSLIGVLFSIYLTFLEPFVIGATCAWCLSSAILMTVLMWLTASKGIKAWHKLQGKVYTHHS